MSIANHVTTSFRLSCREAKLIRIGLVGVTIGDRLWKERGSPSYSPSRMLFLPSRRDEGECVVKAYGRVATDLIPGEKFENEKAIGRALALDQDGNVFTSGEGGRFYRFSTKTRQLERLEIGLPAVPGREVYNRVDAWTADAEGNLYGGTSDGYLFRLNPANLTVVNLGKPLNQYRIRGLVLAHNGKLYGIGGDDDEMARLFSFDPVSGLYGLLGMIDVNRRPYYSWQGYVFDAMTVGLDGTVYMGQAERKSKLYLYYPQ